MGCVAVDCLGLMELRVLEIKTATLLYCREAMLGASPIRQTTPFLPISDGQKDPSTEGKFLADFENQNGASQSALAFGASLPLRAPTTTALRIFL